MDPKDKSQYTIPELVHQYGCSNWSSRGTPEEVMTYHVDTCRKMSEHVRNTISCRLNVPYGPTNKRKMDIFGENMVPKEAPVVVCIHGGYWTVMGRGDYSFMAEPLVKAGALVILPGYEQIPDVTLKEIVTMTEECVRKIISMARERGSRGIYLTGHSAGGQLAAMMLCQQWSKQESDLIKGAVLTSGVFDIRPAIHYLATSNVHLTEQEAWESSPMRLVDNMMPGAKILTAVGSNESPEFIRQSQDYAEVLKQKGLDVECKVIADRDHFDLIENFRDKSDPFVKMMISFFNLNG